MSRKTEQIYKEIQNLEDLQNQISIINKLEKAKSGGEISETERAEKIRHLENIEFDMAQSLKSLRFWFGSLYSYNGKSVSRAKVTASKENGKKGGRPPKEITNLKRRKGELEESVLPDLRREKSVTTDFEKEEKLGGQILEYENELSEINDKLENWNHDKSSLRS